MMYSNKLVACIKVNGKILRENHETVAVPFGSEYSILIKNMSSVRALVRVSIDGTDATESTWLIVPAYGSTELERFIKNGNWDKGNRFKFIERTGAIEDYRGIKAEDGLVRIEYKFEKVYEPQPTYYPYTSYTVTNHWLGGTHCNSSNIGGRLTRSNAPTKGVRSLSFNKTIARPQASMSNNTTPTSSINVNADITFRGFDASDSLECDCDSIVESSANMPNENGITVAGSESNQKFVVGGWFPTEDTTHTMVLKLVGAIQGVKLAQAVTVQHKPTCTTCGRVNKATSKFCSQCGTALQLF